MRKLLLICSVISLIYGNCVWSMDHNEEEPYENPRNDSMDPQKEKVYKNDEKQAIVSAASGKRNNFTENNSDLFNSTMRPVNANDLSKEESYKWILKIASMKKEGKDFNAPQNTEGQTILMCAAKDANCQIMKQILNVIDPEKRPAIINAQDKNGNTALSIAAGKGNIEMIVLLLTNGADVKSVNETKWTELLMHAVKNTGAVKNTDYETIKQFINIRDSEGNRLVDINAQDKNGNTALSIAAEKDNIEMIVLLLTNGADVKSVNETKWTELLMHAEKNTYYEIMGQTILMHAAKDANCEIMKQILNAIDSEKRPAIINAQDKNGNTALSIAAKTNDDKKILLLLTNGADVKLAKKKLTEERSLKQALGKLKELYGEVQDNSVNFLNAIPHGNLEYVKSLLETGKVNVNVCESEEGRTALILALQYDRTEIAKLLLQCEEINVNLQEDKYGATALMFAVQYGYTEIVKLLLELKHDEIDVNAKDKQGYTALMFAAQNGRTEIVEPLLGHEKIDVNAQSNQGFTALMLAAQNGHTDIVKLLLGREIDVNAKNKQVFTALMIAAHEGHTDIVKSLLELKHDEIDVNAKNEQGYTALMLAAQYGHTDIVELLLGHEKIDVNLQDIYGYTALMLAAYKGHEKIVELLLERSNTDENMLDTILARAAINRHTKIVRLLLNQSSIDNRKGIDYSLLLSVVRGYEEVVKLFLEKGIDVNKYINGYTLLMHAIESGNAKMVHFLLKQPNINLEAKNADGKTALDCAERKGRRSIIKLIKSKLGIQDQQVNPFIKRNKKRNKTDSMDKIRERFWTVISRGDINEMDSLLDEEGKVLVDVNAKNKNGDTALIIASSNGNLTALKWLLENGADISIKDKNGDNALIRAARKGHLDVVDELLFWKANINSVGQHGRTALMEAAENGQVRVVKLLIKKGAKSSVKDDYGKTALDLVNEKKINKTDSDYESIKNILESLSKQSNQLFDEVKIETINKWEIVIDKDFEKDLEYWKKNSPAIYKKIKQLIEDIKIDPFRGLGRPERLTGDLEGLYSRRITDGDRLVYDIDGEKVILKSGKGHYKKDKRK